MYMTYKYIKLKIHNFTIYKYFLQILLRFLIDWSRRKDHKFNGMYQFYFFQRIIFLYKWENELYEKYWNKLKSNQYEKG